MAVHWRTDRIGKLFCDEMAELALEILRYAESTPTTQRLMTLRFRRAGALCAESELTSGDSAAFQDRLFPRFDSTLST
jgi:hypothetical protein